ncbi:MAG: hypothetical protein Kow0090_13900 [Myxococcota bacterium]
MKGQLIPWHKYAFVCELASKLKKKKIGKTALQKLVYLFQEIYKEDLGYRFTLYMYGPFCPELMYDLDVTETIGGVIIEPNLSGGYLIKEGKQITSIKSKGKDYITSKKEKITELIKQFGGKNARDLELLATTIYVMKALSASNRTDMEAVKLIIQQIKPKFNSREISNAISEAKNILKN